MADKSSNVTVLIVDDEEPIRDALQRFLALQHFQVLTAGSGTEALQALRSNSVALMLCDIRMPGTSGVDLVPQALQVAPDLAILMLTAVNDATTAALCMQRGAMDYLTKPIELDELSRAVQRALKRRDANLDIRPPSGGKVPEPGRLIVATLEALVNAMEAKDPYLRGHSARVADLSATIAANIGLSDDEIEQVRLAGRLHDIGKIGTRETVMNKQGPLTPEEYEHVKQHVLIGWQILSPLTHLGPVLQAVRHHHERWDGTGYPDGLEGDDIPLGARIIGTAEIFDALSTSRPYQERMGAEQAVRRMGELSGSVLDPAVYQALSEVVTRRRSLVFLDEGGAL